MHAKNKQPKPVAPALVAFHDKAKTLSDARDALGSKLRILQGQIKLATDAQMPSIRKAARQVTQLHAELQAMIKSKPELFESPRSYVTSGLKFGMQKNKGKITWEDDAKVCQRIRDMLALELINADQVDLCIITTEKPAALGLATLDGKVLKRIGVQVTADTDEPVIKAVDSEVEKAINAVIKEVTGDANAVVAA